jgi:hypothetical protein
METALDKGYLPNSCQHAIQTTRGAYLIQIAWPLCWSEDRVPTESDIPISTLLVTLDI